MIDKKIFKKTIGSVLGKSGFVRRSGGWELNANEVMVHVSPQKSQYDQLMYINVDIRVNMLNEVVSDNEFQISCRIESLIQEDFQDEMALFELDAKEWEPKEHVALLNELFELKIVPRLVELSSLDNLKEGFRRGHLDGCLVHREVKAFLASE